MAYEYKNKQLGSFGQGISQADVLNLVSGAVSTAANVGLQVYAQKEAAKAAKRQEKIDAMLAAQQQPQVIMQGGGGGNSSLMIGAIVGGAVLLGLLVFVLTRKKDASPQMGGAVGSATSYAPTSFAPAPPAPRIKRMKRVSRPKLGR